MTATWRKWVKKQIAGISVIGSKELRDVAGESGKNQFGGNRFTGGVVLRVGQGSICCDGLACRVHKPNERNAAFQKFSDFAADFLKTVIRRQNFDCEIRNQF